MRKNRALAVVIAFVLTLCTGVFVACSKSKSSKPADKSYSVTFEYNYEGAPSGPYKRETVSSGTAVAKPADPVRDEYVFTEWTKDAAGTARWNFSTLVTGNLVLYAQWKSESELTLTEIIITNPAKTVYVTGEQFDPTGMTVTAKYSDGSQKSVSPDKCSITGFSSATVGTVTVTVTYGGMSKTFDVTVNSGDEQPERTVTFKYNYLGAPNDGVYRTVNVRNGESVDRPDDPTRPGYRFIDWETKAASGSKYNFSSPVADNLELFASWVRNDPVLIGITVAQKPIKLVYEYGEAFDPTGIEVTSQYDYGNGKTLMANDYSVNVDMTGSGEKTVTVSYTEGAVTKTATFTVTVNPGLSGITVTPPARREYYIGEELDTKGMVVTADYTDGTHTVITEGYSISFDSSSAGQKTVTVYLDANNDILDTFTVQVENPPSTFTVNFYKNDTPASQVKHHSQTGITPGDTVSEPSAPVLSGYHFDGWFTDRNGLAGTDNAYDFSKAVTRSFDLYAGWTRNDPVLQGITVTEYKKTYVVGQTVDKSEIKVVAHYDWGIENGQQVEGHNEEVTGFTFTPPADMNTVGGNKKVRVDFGGKYTEYNIEVIPKAVSSIAYTGNVKTDYFVGDSFDPSALVFTVTYNDGEVTHPQYDNADIVYSVSGLDGGRLTVAGNGLTVTVSYAGKISADTFTVNVTAVAPVSFTYSGNLTKTEYLKGDKISAAGLSDFTVTYNNGAVEHPDASEIKFTAAGIISNNTFVATGTNITVTLYYGDLAAARTQTVAKVTAPVLTANKWYMVGTFNSWGMAADTAEYLMNDSTANGRTVYTSAGNIKLVANSEFKIAKCVDPDAVAQGDRYDTANMITASANDKLSVNPVYGTGLLVIELTEDYNKNIKIVSIDDDVKNEGWIVTFTDDGSAVSVNISLDYVDLRSPQTGNSDANMQPEAASAEVYLTGNFSGNFKFCNAWSSSNTAIASSYANGQNAKNYYFTKVYLKSFDSFKLYVKNRGEAQNAGEPDPRWLGGTLGAFANGKATAELSAAGADICVGKLPQGGGYYNIYFDEANDKLEIYEWENVEISFKKDIYQNHTPDTTYITVKLGGNAVSDYMLKAEPAVAEQLMSSLTVIVNGGVYVHKYSAIKLAVTGITVVEPAVKSLYVCRTIGKQSITVTAHYNSGDAADDKVIGTDEFSISEYTKQDYDGVTGVADPLNDGYTTSVTVSLNSDPDIKYVIEDVVLYNHPKNLIGTVGGTFFVGDSVTAADFTKVQIEFNTDEEKATNIRANYNGAITVDGNEIGIGDNVVTFGCTVKDGLGNDVALTGSVTVIGTNIEVSEITFTSPASTPRYYSGMDFDGAGYTFTVSYNNGKNTHTVAVSQVTLTSDYFDVNGKLYTTEFVSDAVISVSYTENGKTVYADKDIHIELDKANGTYFSVRYYGGLGDYPVSGLRETGENVLIGSQPISAPDEPTAKGFNFVCWADKNGSIITFPYKVVQDVEMYAQWSPISYEVEYNLNCDDALNSTLNSATYTAVNNVYPQVELKNATRTYYNFAGWFTEATGGVQVRYLEYGRLPANSQPAKISLYAHWEEIVYTIEYNVGSFGERIASDKVTILTIGGYSGLPTVVINDAGRLSGQRFIGWYSAGEGGDGITSVTAANSIDTLGAGNTTYTVFAHYSDLYTVTFDPDGGEFADHSTANKNVEVIYGHKFGQTAGDGVKPADPKRSGYQFVCWVRMGTSAEFDFAKDTVTADISLTAKWLENVEGDGIYIRITYDDWKTYSQYVAVADGYDLVEPASNRRPQYRVDNLTLAENAVFLINIYKDGEIESAVKPGVNFAKATAEAGAIEIDRDGSAFNNFKVVKYDAKYVGAKWTLYVSENMASPVLVRDELVRDPVTGGADTTSTPVQTATADVYIRGTFTYVGTQTEKWALFTQWSSDSGKMPTAKITEGEKVKYLFSNVYLKPFDQFKLFVPANGAPANAGDPDLRWLGGSFAGVGEPFDVSSSGGDIVLTGFTAGNYDLVYNKTDNKLTVYAHKELTGVQKSVIYASAERPSEDAFTFAYGTDNNVAATIISDKTVTDGVYKVKVYYGNTVSYITYNATAVVATGITVVNGNEPKAYKVGDTFSAAGFTVYLEHNDKHRVELQYGVGYTVSALPTSANCGDMFTGKEALSLTFKAKDHDDDAFSKTVNIGTIENVFTGIEIGNLPEQYYYQGYEFDTAGLQVNAIFNGKLPGETENLGTVKRQNIASGYTLSEPDMELSVPGQSVAEQTVTVTYDYGGKSYTASFLIYITVLTVEDISVNADDAVTEFSIGSEFAYTGVAITGTYNDGLERAIDGGDAVYGIPAEYYDAVNKVFLKTGTTSVTVTAYGKTDVYAITVTALTVSFDANGGTLTGANSATVNVYRGTVTAPEASRLARQHYDFAAWYTDANCTAGNEWSDSTELTESITLYAKWTPKTYYVRFMRNDGTTGEGAVFKTVPVVYSPTARVELPGTSDLVHREVTLGTGTFNFNYWSLGSDEDSEAFDAQTYITGDLTLYAIWTNNTVHTVTFINSQDGSTITTKPVIHGRKVEKPADPQLTGYKFIKWVYSSGGDFSFDTEINADTSLKAIWEAKSFKVKFELGYNAEGVNPPAPQTVSYGERIQNPGSLNRTGYTFNGWYYGAETDSWVFTRTMPDGVDGSDFVLVARWTADTYNVTFDTRGGAPVPDATTVDYDATIRRPDDPEKEGFKFKNWELADHTVWNFDRTMDLERSLTLYAVWERESYTLTFNSDGETVKTVQNVAFEANIAEHKPASLQKEGYKLDGWEIGGSLWDFSSDTMPASDLVLTAKWTKNKYSLTYKDHGDNTVQTAAQVEYGTSLTHPEAAARTGYVFDGWKDSGGNTYTAMPASNLVLKATYIAIEYTLVYATGSYGNVIDSVQDFTVENWKGVGTLASVTVNGTGTAGGWYFNGWTLGENGDAITGITLESIAGIEADAQHKATVTVVAHYDNHYTVSFNVNKPANVSASVQNVPAQVSVEYNGTVGALATAPTLEGYVLAGWYTSQTPAASAVAFRFGTGGDTVTDNTVLYAKWEKAPAEDGVYLLGTFNGWLLSDDNIMHYKANVTTENGEDKYEVNGITFAKNDTMKFVKYETGKALVYMDPYSRKDNIYTPSSLTVSVNTGDNNNLAVTAVTPITEKDTYTVIWGKNGEGKLYVSFELETRDPSFGDTVTNNVGEATADVYIRGSMTKGFGLNNNWSSNSEVLDVVHETAGGKDIYYFQNVYLVPIDSFKIYVKATDTWLGHAITANNQSDANAVTVSADGDGNITGLPEAAYYNIVFNNGAASNKKITIYKSGTLTSQVSVLYGTQQPDISKLMVFWNNTRVKNITEDNLYAVDAVNKTYTVKYLGQFKTTAYTTVDIAPASLNRVTVAPAKTQYKPGEAIALAGIKLSGTNNDGSAFEAEADRLEPVTATVPNAKVGSGRNVLGEYNVPIELRLKGTDLTFTYNIKVSNVLSRIELAGKPTSFVQYTNASYTGMTVTAYFNEGIDGAEFSLVLNADEYTVDPVAGTEFTAVTTGRTVTVTACAGLACGTQTAQFNVAVTAPVISAVSVSVPDADALHVFRVGDRFTNNAANRAGLVFTATYNNGLPVDMNGSDFVYGNLSFAWDSTKVNAAREVITDGSVSVTVMYGDIPVSGSLTYVVHKKVTGIVITRYPSIPSSNKVDSWVVGNKYTKAGMEITVIYNEGVTGATQSQSTGVQNTQFTVDIHNTDLTEAKTYKAVLTYDGYEYQYDVAVVANNIYSVAATGSLNKTNYTVGDKFSGAGLTFTATRNDGSTEVISAIRYEFEKGALTSNDYVNANEQFKRADTGITVKPMYENIAVSGGPYTVSVENKLTSIEVTDIPMPPSTPAGRDNVWIAGDALTLEGMRIRLHYNAGITGADSAVFSELTVNAGNRADFTCDDLDVALQAGSNTYTVYYKEALYNKALSAQLTVSAVAVSVKSLAASGNTPATQYLNSTFITGDIVFTATYNDGRTQTVPAASITFTANKGGVSYMNANGEFTSAGEGVTVTATFGGKSCNITGVTVAEASAFNITFDSAGGTEISAIPPVNYNETVTRPANPTRKGYEFRYWAKDGSEYDFNTRVTSSFTLVAVWRARTDYKVEYYDDETGAELTVSANGGNALTYLPVSNEFPEVTLNNASKAYYDFKGWYLNGNRVEKLTYASIPATGDTIALYAKFEKKSYTVTFYNNYQGATPASYTAAYKYGESTVLGDPAARPGYTFDAWYSKPASEGWGVKVEAVAFADGGMSTPSSLYAKWTVKTVNVEFKNNYTAADGLTDTVQGYTCEGPFAVVTPESRPGYEFKGWYPKNGADNDWGTRITAIAFVDGEIVTQRTLYAKWEAVSVEVKLYYNYDSSDNRYDPASYTCESANLAVARPAARPGYEFKGWYLTRTPASTDSEVTAVVFENGVLTVPANNTPDLYAKWEAVKTAVKFYKNHTATDNSFETQEYTCEGPFTLPTPDARSGYEFKGWYLTRTPASTDSAVTAVVYTNGVLTVPAKDTPNLYAKWEAVSYTVNFEAIDGELTDSTLTYNVTMGNKYLSDIKPEPPENMRFIGWYSAATSGAGVTQIEYVNLDSFDNITKEITVWAWYEPNTHTVTFKDNDGSTVLGSVTVLHNGTVNEEDVPAPTKLRYYVSGWKKGNSLFNLSTAITADTELTVVWTYKNFTTGYYVDDTKVKDLEIGGKDSDEYVAKGIVVKAGQVISVRKTEGNTAAGWISFTAVNGYTNNGFTKNGTDGAKAGSKDGAYDFYAKTNGNQLWVGQLENGRIYVSANLQSGDGVYVGSDIKKPFVENLGSFNDIMATGVSVGAGAGSTTYTVKLKFCGIMPASITSVETAAGITATLSDNTLTMYAGTYDFYYTYAVNIDGKAAGSLYIGGTQTGVVPDSAKPGATGTKIVFKDGAITINFNYPNWGTDGPYIYVWYDDNHNSGWSSNKMTGNTLNFKSYNMAQCKMIIWFKENDTTKQTYDTALSGKTLGKTYTVSVGQFGSGDNRNKFTPTFA